MTAPAALIFDCDGTLALTADLHFDAFSRALARQGAVMPRDWYAARTGLSRHDLLTALAAESAPSLDIAAAIRDSIALTLEGTGVCKPNAPVAALARRWGPRPMAVASNAERAVVLSILRACRMGGLFSCVVSLDEVTHPKPDPEMFVTAARLMHQPAAACLVIEDSDQGLEAARRAGMQSLDVRDPAALPQLRALGRAGVKTSQDARDATPQGAVRH